MRYDNIGASSIAHYDHAPENYKVDDGGYTLMCDYSKSVSSFQSRDLKADV